ncbi:MAG: methylaspartate mutase [Jatrophihabitantaceae bacterium]
MRDFGGLELAPQVSASLPAWEEAASNLRRSPAAVHVLRHSVLTGRPAVQPRCGVGGHDAMLGLLHTLARSGPSMLSLTIDSHTRLRQFERAARTLAEHPGDLNGYPLVAHGWQRGRELVTASPVPLEVRHGSPDARDLFAVALASGITSFEGGGIGYNLPYSKNVSLNDSLLAWNQVDATCGVLAEAGVVIDRELFGTLTAVLVPPSISVAVTVLEGVLAARAGVRCLSPAYPQGGEAHQDVAALRALAAMTRRYVGPDVEIFPVLHEFMGAFPRGSAFADGLILQGGLVARLGGAAKVINKTHQEAFGLPDAEANMRGIRTAAIGASDLFEFVAMDADRIAEEQHWIEREVAELVEPILGVEDLAGEVATAFAEGRLDIPFSASVYARSAIVPRRDAAGAIRYAETGSLPFSAATVRHNSERLASVSGGSLIEAVTEDIYYFLRKEGTQSLEESDDRRY